MSESTRSGPGVARARVPLVEKGTAKRSSRPGGAAALLDHPLGGRDERQDVFDFRL